MEIQADFQPLHLAVPDRITRSDRVAGRRNRREQHRHYG